MAFGDDATERDELVPVAVEHARRAGVTVLSPTVVVVVGDTPLDVRCAAASGARSIAVATGSYDELTLQAHGATVVFPDFSGTEAFLAALEKWLPPREYSAIEVAQ